MERSMRIHRICALVILFLGLASFCVAAQSANSTSNPQKVIFDTDIGDDIDDAFALGLAVSSPELKVLGVTTAWGNTKFRAQLSARLLCDFDLGDIPVSAGPRTNASNVFTQAKWASQYRAPENGWPDAVQFILDQIRRNPGEITLISVAPFSNVGKLIDTDPDTFRKLKRVVIMGGSIHRRYGDLGYLPDRGPEPEYNIKMDVPSARKLFASGVPTYMMPLDSTQLKLQEVERNIIFTHGSALTDDLALLYYQWSAATQNPTPTLFDAMAVAYAVEPDLCPTTPMHIEVDDSGLTRATSGTPNANVCLNSSSERFFHFYIQRILSNRMGSRHTTNVCGQRGAR
jgi:purine nucleosidase